MKRSPLFVIFITVFIDLVSFGIVIPLLPFYAQQFGASGITVGLLLSVFSMMTFLFMPVWGKLSDHHGRRPIILITVVGSVIAYILFSTATSLWMLFLSRTLAGIANSNLSVAQAYIADVTKPEERAKGMGLIGSAFGLGFVFGPLISGIFSAEYFGSLKYTLPGWIAAGLSLINLITAFFLLPESLEHDKRTIATARSFFDIKGFKRALQIPQLGIIIILLCIVTVAFSNIFATFPLFVMEPPFGLSSSHTGWFFVEIGIFSAIIQGGLIGRLNRIFGEKKLIVIGVTLMMLGFIGFPISALLGTIGIYGVMAGTAFLSMGSSCLTPSIMSLASQLADPGEQGVILGIVQSFASLARMFGPTLGGVVYDVAGHTTPFYLAAFLMAGSVFLAIRLHRHGHFRNDEEKAAA